VKHGTLSSISQATELFLKKLKIKGTHVGINHMITMRYPYWLIQEQVKFDMFYDNATCKTGLSLFSSLVI